MTLRKFTDVAVPYVATLGLSLGAYLGPFHEMKIPLAVAAAIAVACVTITRRSRAANRWAIGAACALAVATPPVVVVGLLFVYCHDGGCFS